jgi:ABC-type lipoprotein release transport system permease subunit
VACAFIPAALAASYIPARRATLPEAMIVLRNEWRRLSSGNVSF